MSSAGETGWYVSRKGQNYGPYTWGQIVEHAKGGRIGRADMVLDPRTGAWAKPMKVPGLFGPGGAATTPAGIALGAKIAVGAVLGMAIVLGAYVSIWYAPLSGAQAEHMLGEGAAIMNDSRPNTSASAALPPEGLAFKGTFEYESVEGVGVPNIRHSEACYFWVYTTDDGTAATLDYGTNYIDSWPVYLKSSAGTSYVLESSDRSLVGRVRISASVTPERVSGRVTKIDRVGNFAGGTFECSSVPYEEYKAAVVD